MKEHGIAKHRNVGGFQPERQVICRCGWESDTHYSRTVVMKQFRLHAGLPVAPDGFCQAMVRYWPKGESDTGYETGCHKRIGHRGPHTATAVWT